MPTKIIEIDTDTQVVVPTDQELLNYASEAQFFLFADEGEVLDIMRETLSRFGNRTAAPQPEQPTTSVYTAADMASQAAQGFRDGAESVSKQPAQPVATWFPIETAPKDGETVVDLWFPKHGRRTNWRWYKKNKFWGSMAGRFDKIDVCDELPTHWKPLPQPPGGVE